MRMPTSLGVYLLYGLDNMVYVGRSKNIRERVGQHTRDDTIPSIAAVAWVKTPTVTDAIALEKQLVKTLRPPLNIKKV